MEERPGPPDISIISLLPERWPEFRELRLRARPDLRRAVLSVNIHQEPAIRLCTRFGFRTIDTQNLLMGDGKHHDEYLMELLLDDAP